MKQANDRNTNELFMLRCLELASGGLGRISPNPMVGAVIVSDGKIIGEGYHRQFGKVHAEVNAIHAVKDKALLGHSILYVNLEPCVHTGKTPPCTELILQHNIPVVVLGTPDPNPLVGGRGINRLKEKGVQVITGILEQECIELNKRFFTFHNKKRPYIILKWAQTKDGFIDILRKPGESVGIHWISCPLSRNLVHRWRAEEQAVMAGSNTVLMDNPKLNVRYWEGPDPVRVIIDRLLRIPSTCSIWDDTQPTLIFNTKKNGKQGQTELIRVGFSDGSLDEVFQHLFQRDIISVIVEGGKKIHEYLIQNNLWDEARIFIGNKTFIRGIEAPVINRKPGYESKIFSDRILVYRNMQY